MDTLEGRKTTKISQVTPEVTWFLRGLGLSDYYIIKIYDSVGASAVGMTQEWVLNDNITSAETVVQMMFNSMPENLRRILF